MKKNKILGLWFVFSFPFITLLVCGGYGTKFVLGVTILSFLLGVFLKKKILKEKFYEKIDKKKWIIATIISFYTNGLLMQYAGGGINLCITLIKKIFGITVSFNHVLYIISFLSLFSMITIIYCLNEKIIPAIKKEYKNATKNEKLFVLITVIAGFFITTVLFNLTNVFYKPVYNDKPIYYDVIYTSDSGAITENNAYLNISMAENDLRQPIFGVASMPFAVVANFVSMFFKFIPNAYEIIFTTIQIGLIALAIIMLARMMNIEEKQKKYFWILSYCCYPFIIFSFLAEQYIFAFFYLILAIYIGYFRLMKVNYLYIGAVGTLLTSGIIFPAITKYENFKNWIKNVFKCFIGFLTVSILSGQILQFATIGEQLEKFATWSGKNVLFIDKLKQFFSFVLSIFIAPQGKIVIIDNIPHYFLEPVETISFIGILILVICFISFLLHRKSKIAQISFLWIIFSFLILCVIGWGSQENGMILYSLYFAWAYIILFYLFIEKIFTNQKLKRIIYIAIFIVLFIFNIKVFFEIVKFGMQYYC